MQLSIVLSRIEAEETNGSEGKLQTEGGGGGGGMKCGKLETLRCGREIGENEREKGEQKEQGN